MNAAETWVDISTSDARKVRNVIDIHVQQLLGSALNVSVAIHCSSERMP
jgi:hypothetical protein